MLCVRVLLDDLFQQQSLLPLRNYLKIVFLRGTVKCSHSGIGIWTVFQAVFENDYGLQSCVSWQVVIRKTNLWLRMLHLISSYCCKLKGMWPFGKKSVLKFTPSTKILNHTQVFLSSKDLDFVVISLSGLDLNSSTGFSEGLSKFSLGLWLFI